MAEMRLGPGLGCVGSQRERDVPPERNKQKKRRKIDEVELHDLGPWLHVLT